MKLQLPARLISLSEKLKSIEFSVYRGEDGKFYTADGKPAGADGLPIKAVAGGVLAAGAAGGAFVGHRAIMKAGGGDQIIGKGAVRQAYGNVGRSSLAGALGGASDAVSNAGARVARAGVAQNQVIKKGGSIGKALRVTGQALLRKPF